MKLSNRIQELADEVASSRVYIDKLLKTTHDTQQDDWEKREDQYKTVIKNLRQQIRKQTPAVSIELYKAAVDKGKKKQEELNSAEEKLATLESKVTQLEKEKNNQLPFTAMKIPRDQAGIERSNIMSPTDFLEKGLLSESYVDNVDISPISFNCKTPSHSSRKQPLKNSMLYEQRQKFPEDRGDIIADQASGQKGESKNSFRFSGLLPLEQFQKQRHASPLGQVTDNAQDGPKQRDSSEPGSIQRKSPPKHVGWYSEIKKSTLAQTTGLKHFAPKEQSKMGDQHSSRKLRDRRSPNEESKGNKFDGRQKVCMGGSVGSLTGITISFPTDLVNDMNQALAALGSGAQPSSQTRDEGRRGSITAVEDDVMVWVDNYAKRSLREHQSHGRHSHVKQEMKQKIKVRTQHIRKQSVTKKSDLDLRNDSMRSPALVVHNDNETQRVSEKSKRNNVNERWDPPGYKSLSAPIELSPKTPNQKENFAPKTPKSSRMQRVREIGGRKALQEKLKKMRSPPQKAPRGKTLPLRPVQVN